MQINLKQGNEYGRDILIYKIKATSINIDLIISYFENYKIYHIIINLNEVINFYFHHIHLNLQIINLSYFKYFHSAQNAYCFLLLHFFFYCTHIHYIFFSLASLAVILIYKFNLFYTKHFHSFIKYTLSTLPYAYILILLSTYLFICSSALF